MYVLSERCDYIAIKNKDRAAHECRNTVKTSKLSITVLLKLSAGLSLFLPGWILWAVLFLPLLSLFRWRWWIGKMWRRNRSMCACPCAWKCVCVSYSPLLFSLHDYVSPFTHTFLVYSGCIFGHCMMRERRQSHSWFSASISCDGLWTESEFAFAWRRVPCLRLSPWNYISAACIVIVLCFLQDSVHFAVEEALF